MREYIWQTKITKNKTFISNAKWKGDLSVIVGAGTILIVNHTGSTEGFIQGCGEYFVDVTDRGVLPQTNE